VQTQTDIRGSKPFDLGRMIATRCVEFRSSMTDVALSAAAKSPETRQTRSPGDLGSPVRARTDLGGPTNSLACIRPRERD
jgi:hypothetical protein